MTTASGTTLVGAEANPSAATASNEIVIGHNATGLGSNYAVIGNADVTRLYAAEDGAAVLYANATIQASDSRLKKEIQALPLGRNFLYDLMPVRFRWRATKGEDKIEMGLIAQDAVAAMRKHGLDETAYGLVHQDEGGHYRMNYTQLVAPLINAVKELSVENHKMKKEIKVLKEQMVAVLARVG